MVVVECKLKRGSLERVKREGADQIREYMVQAGAAEGHLVLFDRTDGATWQERISRVQLAGKPPVTAWGL